MSFCVVAYQSLKTKADLRNNEWQTSTNTKWTWPPVTSSLSQPASEEPAKGTRNNQDMKLDISGIFNRDDDELSQEQPVSNTASFRWTNTKCERL